MLLSDFLYEEAHRFIPSDERSGDANGLRRAGETVLWAARCPNVYIDTSSANGWLRYMPSPMDLKLVFQRTLEAVGAERISFGTGSIYFPRGFRRELLGEQLGVLEALGMAKADVERIMCGNMARFLRLAW